MVSVAIDGPAGAGKSTIARAAAHELGFIYVDTGALYRAIGLFAHEAGKDAGNAGDIAGLLPGICLELRFLEGEQRVFCNGRDVSEEIRRPDMGLLASQVSAIPAVRAFLLDLQRNMAKHQNIIMDGRDIGTVVLPNADVKIFLTASAEERAQRRYREHLAKGEDVRYNDVLEDMRRRDYNDENRAIAPLVRAEDAIPLDTTGLKKTESIQRVIDIITAKIYPKA